MTEKNLLKLAENMPDMVKEILSSGFPATYRSDEYPDILLKEYPNGRLESVGTDEKTFEPIVLEVLRDGKE